MRRRLIALTLLLSLALAGGCTTPADDGIASADGSAAPTPSPSVDEHQAVLNFAKCMREHGQNVRDPHPGDPFVGPSPLPPGWQTAEGACRSLLPGGGGEGSGGPSAEELEQLRAFAVCMRAHDIPITDPELPGAGDRPGNMRIEGRFNTMLRDQVENDPGYKAAIAACQDKLPNNNNDDKKDG